MNSEKAVNWLKYYRNSLADGEMLDIKTKDCESGEFFDSFGQMSSDKLKRIYDKYFIKTIKRKIKSQVEEEDTKNPIDIFISPFYLSPRNIHGKKKANIKKIYPFWIPAVLSNSGELSPPAEESRLPWFMRSLLEPVFYDVGSIPIVSAVQEVDKVLDSFNCNKNSWNEYWASAEDFFVKVTGFKYNEYSFEGYNTINTICLIKAKNVVSAQHILNIYDDLMNTASYPELLKKILYSTKPNRKRLPDNSELFLSKGHYGQYGNQFPLSTSQRQSLLLFEQENSGEVLAVNGPPGTGKTTLLQSIVANIMVQAALKGDKPPQIVASSTNNQAITNILDSFESGDSSLNRWIPNINSLGAYLISNDSAKQDEAREKGYQLLYRADNLLEGFYFRNLEINEMAGMEKYYIDYFSHEHQQLKQISVGSCVAYLHNRITEGATQIDDILEKIENFYRAEADYFPLDKLSELKKEIEQLEELLSGNENNRAELVAFRNRYNQFVDNNKYSLFFSFIPFVRKNYQRKLSLFLIDSPTSLLRSQISNKGVESVVIDLIKSIDEQIPILEEEIQTKKQIFAKLTVVKADFDSTKEKIDVLLEAHLKTKSSKEREIFTNELGKVDFIEQVNHILDVSIRHSIFVDTIHYWEGKWLLEQNKKENEANQNKGKASRVKTFAQISYLTPLFISTFHSLPGFCSFFEKTNDNWAQKPIYEFFDLLIVDEAGQVSPEVAVASFSLAKRALVVGDIHQIEPIWSIAFENIDEGNLAENQLLNNENFEYFKNLGLLCSSGSLMHLARNASEFEVNSQMGGTILTEHRRCVNELVAFSNEFVYENMLIPKVGSMPDADRVIDNDETNLFLPPLSYVNVRGQSEKRNGSSFNSTEAEAIAKWIAKYGKAIASHFSKGKPKEKQSQIKDCIAVITPFAEQKKEIYRFFGQFGVDTQITVGTVHALQGAERPLVIFSPAYGTNHNSGHLFFDSGYNMLNVALTRAKKHFVVIGNMSLFNPISKQRPSGGLAKYLFADEQNEIPSSFIFEGMAIEIKNRIDSLEKHQKCIARAFEVAKERVIIVSPFVSIHAIHADAIVQKIKKCTQNNVKVTVYTDKYLDMPNNKLKPSAFQGRNALTDAGAELVIVNGIHNKALAKDEDLLIEGSFNWLSAIRTPNHSHYRFDVSHIIQNNEAKKNIDQLLKEVEKLIER